MAENSFDNLVSGISQDERKSMLDKIGKNAVPSPLEDEIQPKKIERGITVVERFHKEPILLRLMLWIKSLVKGIPSIELYKSFRVDRISKSTEAAYRDMINCKNETILNAFYENLSQVNTAANFFASFMIEVEKNPEDYTGFLADTVIPSVCEEINQKCDPYSMPFETNPSSELRASFVKKMDEIFDHFDSEKKQLMYTARKAAEWLMEFVKIPYGSILDKFLNGENGKKYCKFGTLENDINRLSKVFCNIPELPSSVFESLFYFYGQNATLVTDSDPTKTNIDEYNQMVSSQLSMVKMFVNAVPLENLGKIVSDNADWQCPSFGGGENWFQKFKAQKKSVFDKRWESWVRDCQKEELRKKFYDFYGIEKFPLLPNRPWSSFAKDFPFKSELTSGFLFWFFNVVFKKIEGVLKTVMLEGDFAIKENRVVFTDSYNELLGAMAILNNLDKKLVPSGELGMGFQKLHLIGINVAAGRARLLSMLSAIETDVGLVVKKFGNSCRAISPIIKGFFATAMDKIYGPLNNFMMIKGKENEKFRNDLEDAKKQLETAYDFVVKLEPIDMPSVSG